MNSSDPDRRPAPQGHTATEPSEPLSDVESEVARRCEEMIEQAHQQATRILEAAAAEAVARRRRDADLIADLGRQVAEMSTAYQEAMTAARRTVDFLAAKVRMGTEQHQM